MFLNPRLAKAHRRAQALLSIVPPYARRRWWFDQDAGPVQPIPQPDCSYTITWVSGPPDGRGQTLTVTFPPDGLDRYEWAWDDGKGNALSGGSPLTPALPPGLRDLLARVHGRDSLGAKLRGQGKDR